VNTIEFLVVGLPVWVAVGWWFVEAHRGLFPRKPKKTREMVMAEHMAFLVNCPKWHGLQNPLHARREKGYRDERKA